MNCGDCSWQMLIIYQSRKWLKKQNHKISKMFIQIASSMTRDVELESTGIGMKTFSLSSSTMSTTHSMTSLSGNGKNVRNLSSYSAITSCPSTHQDYFPPHSSSTRTSWSWCQRQDTRRPKESSPAWSESMILMMDSNLLAVMTSLKMATLGGI